VKATLTYHALDDSGSAISVAPDAFARHLQWLSSGTVRVLTLGQLVNEPDDAADAVAITFDDGFLNARSAVDRILDCGFPVTIFAVTRHVGGANNWGAAASTTVPALPLLDWPDLERLAARGAAIESHTRTHVALPGRSDAAIDDELQGCREDLYTRLGMHSTHLAYPYGEVDDTVAARAAVHYRFAHTTEFRVLTTRDAPMKMPRLDMYYFQSPGALEAWGTRAFARRVAWCAAKRKIRARIVGGWAPRSGVSGSRAVG
jgi:peptidoglycan/xylan/chitin deacetylase (PgdA/CDA1 family)